MLRSLPTHLLFVTVLLCGAVFAQAPESQLPDAPQPQPQAKPPQPPQPPEEQQDQRKEKKPESKVKSTLKRGAPNCIHIGGVEKCKAPSAEDEERDESQAGPQQPQVPNSQRLPRSSDPNESSSKDSQLPPMPGSTAGDPAADVQEFHAFNPHRADKSVEVGDFYFKRGNYRAAESRYAEALLYMSNHALATYKLAEVQEKLGKTAEARSNYQKYLKILPKGELAEEARKALARLDAQAKQTPPTSPPVQKRP
jgi:tetratricopeptide (TPR) repeat protein